MKLFMFVIITLLTVSCATKKQFKPEFGKRTLDIKSVKYREISNIFTTSIITEDGKEQRPVLYSTDVKVSLGKVGMFCGSASGKEIISKEGDKCYKYTTSNCSNQRTESNGQVCVCDAVKEEAECPEELMVQTPEGI